MAEDAEAGFREIGLLRCVRRIAARIVAREEPTALEAAKDDQSPTVRRAVQWAIRQIDDDRR